MRRRLPRLSLVAPLAPVALVSSVSAQEAVRPGERLSVSEQRLEIYDAVGTVPRRPGTGTDFTIADPPGRPGAGGRPRPPPAAAPARRRRVRRRFGQGARRGLVAAVGARRPGRPGRDR